MLHYLPYVQCTKKSKVFSAFIYKSKDIYPLVRISARLVNLKYTCTASLYKRMLVGWSENDFVNLGQI